MTYIVKFNLNANAKNPYRYGCESRETCDGSRTTHRRDSAKRFYSRRSATLWAERRNSTVFSGYEVECFNH